MALLSSAAAPPSARRPTGPLLSFLLPSLRCSLNPSARISSTLRREAPAKSLFLSSDARYVRKRRGFPRSDVRTAASHLCEQERPAFDRSFLSVGEAMSDDELWASIRLRVRTFYNFNESYGIEDYKAYVAKREFEGLKDRIAGKTMGFRKASCINATLPISAYGGSIDELCSVCKFSKKKGDRVVVGTLDINWCLQMPDELTGKRPEGLGADLTRAYLSNVCVAKELQRNGLGYALIGESKTVAHSWGITDLYVHVAVDNEAAQKLYAKSGFIYESEEPAWRARFLGRPRRYLLWTDLGKLS
ncbi:hypothetical protein C4D60_Mb03t21820 [Musa balbisiana]|uniref:N-acetyltransferase domain-containing protein n=1 Tax=Musa balbisiana TaxID=52838 RepID=A0A4S8JBL0_MUSBA|nr:hypothetical protein C4D60_Mb03t21820 [Musa balbisiana]